MSEQIYHAFAYYRLSKEDYAVCVHGKNPSKQIKDESNSITNQRGLVSDFLQYHQDIKLVDEFIDDGYTGLDFERPGFQEMMKRAVSEKINCIIVKDFSRLGRDYLENCRYIERIFPRMDIRFISINDGYDSASERTQSDNIIIPFKNLMNENYSRDTSMKIRTNQEVKRKSSDFIAPFTVYGYKKDEENHNRLVPDPTAAAVVEEIFLLKVSGLNQKAIADQLNQSGTLTPMEYKAYCGSRYESSFRQKECSVWSENMVTRILKNRVYVGDLEQGKVKKVNYKIATRKLVPRDQWVRCEKVHEPIVSDEIFETVQHLLELDTRVSPGKNSLYLFSGLLFCEDCKMSMVRKPVKKGDKTYYYYVCSSWKNDKSCKSHRIKESVLYETVLKTVQAYTKVIADVEKVVLNLDCNGITKRQMEKTEAEFKILHEKEEQIKQARLSLYEDYKKEIIDQDEYIEFKALYSEELMTLKGQMETLEAKRREYEAGKGENLRWMEKFKKYGGIEMLERAALVLMVHHIEVFEDRSIRVVFYNEDEMAQLLKLIDVEAI